MHTRRTPRPVLVMVGLILVTSLLPGLEATTLPAPLAQAPLSADPSLLSALLSNVALDEASGIRGGLAETVIDVNPDGTYTTVYRQIFQIAEAKALDTWGTFSVQWSPWYEEKPELRFRVMNPGSPDFTMDTSAALEVSGTRPDDLNFTDSRTLKLPLQNLRVGSMVEQVTTVRQHSPFFKEGTIRLLYPYTGYKVAWSRLAVTSPATMNLNFQQENLPLGAVRTTVTEGRVTRDLTLANLEAGLTSTNAVPYNLRQYPMIGFTSGKSWADVAAGYGAMVDQALASHDLTAVAASLKGVTEGDTIANVVLHVRATLRYTGVYLGDSSIRPHPLKDILDMGYGDCKDMALYTVALLRTLGIPAHVVLLRAGTGLDVPEKLPGLGVFNHAIVRTGTKAPLWVDPTASLSPALALPAEDQDRRALIIQPGSTTLISTPASESADNTMTTTLVYRLADYGWADLEASSVYKGLMATTGAGWFADKTPAAARTEFAKLITDDYRGGELATFTTSTSPGPDRTFTMAYTLKGQHRAITDDFEAKAAIMPSYFLNNLPSYFLAEDAGTRSLPYYNPWPRHMEWTVSIIPPAGFQVLELPEDLVTRAGGVTFTIAFTKLPDGSAEAKVVLDTGTRLMDTASFKAAAEALGPLSTQDGLMVTFIHQGTVLSQQDRHAESLALFKDLAEAHPGSEAHQRRLVLALLETGLVFPAQETLTAALALNPTSVLLTTTRGFVLSHDMVGRRYGASMDRNGAIAAYRLALKLDPTDEDTWFELAYLQERDDIGAYRGSGADLHGALATYRHLWEDLGNPNAVDELIELLLLTGRTAEAASLVSSLNSDEHRAYYSFLADILAPSPPKVSARITRIAGKDLQGKVLTWSYSFLLQARKYALAADVAELSARGTTNSVTVGAQAALLRTTGAGLGKIPASPVESLGRTLLEGLLHMEDNTFPPALLKAVSPELGTLLVRNPERFQVVSRTLRNYAKQQQLPYTIITDMMLGSMTVSTEGSAGNGYRVTMSYDINGATNTIVYFVDELGHQSRITAMGDLPSSFGFIIDRALKEGNGVKAAWWLEQGRTHSTAIAALFTREPALGTDPATIIANTQNATFLAALIKAQDNDLTSLEELAALVPGHEALATAFRLGLDAMKKVSRVPGPELQRLALTTLANGMLEARKESQGIHYAAALAALRLAQGPTRPDDYLSTARSTLQQAGAIAELAHLETWLRSIKGDEDLITDIQIDRLVLEGRFQEALPLLRTLAATHATKPGYWNNAAWYMLFVDPLPEDIMDTAIKAYQSGGNTQSSILHTIAAILARLHRPQDALALLRTSMDADLTTVPDDNEWLVLGSIAESYGLEDYAASAYRKIKPDSKRGGEAGSSHALALLALARMAH